MVRIQGLNYRYRTHRKTYKEKGDTLFNKIQTSIWSNTYDDLIHLGIIRNSWHNKIDKIWGSRIYNILAPSLSGD